MIAIDIKKAHEREQRIENAWKSEVNKVNSRKKHACSKVDVVRYLFEKRNDSKVWYWSCELIESQLMDGTKLSHRACARASDLAIHFPEIFECRKESRFAAYRLKTENIKKIMEFIKGSR